MANLLPSHLYEPLDFFVLRAPLLSVEAYRALSRDLDFRSTEGSSDAIRRALAVGSVALLDAAGPARNPGPTRNQRSRRSKIESKLLRYMIRMSTRPTPFGLFAGVALGQWGERTDLELSAAPRRQRTRPDMAWLLGLVMNLESRPEVRRHLRLVANPAALIRAGRVFLAERVSRGDALVPPAVSIRATGVVRRALLAARDPVPYETLAAWLLENTAEATAEKVETLLTGLWEQTLLLTDLRPPLTVESPAGYVVDRLASIPAAAGVRAEIQSVLNAAAEWDASPHGGGVERYRAMVAQAANVAPFDRSPFQVDSAVRLTGHTVSRLVSDEVARAAELLLRSSPWPQGPSYLSAYRRAFNQRYGERAEAPLLELLDPGFGLGPPWTSGANQPAAAGISQARSAERSQALFDLAVTALRERTRSVNLDEQILKDLETCQPSTEAPQSLDLFVSVAATSRDALDTGDFTIVVGPNVGGLAAGRTLGRFTDLLTGAREALERAAETEKARAPQKLWAELAYQPRLLRLGNVSIRPNVRQYEIAVGVSSGVGADRTVPLDELVVGVRDDRFYVRWPASGQDIAIASGHMLTPLRAPAVCRFLSELSRDGCCQLSGFQWGAAARFPFLPRVQVGRVVLALAQWRLSTATATGLSPRHPGAFQEALAGWRENWHVPQHVYLSAGDNRLLLDLAAPAQADELRRALMRLRGDGAVVLTEVFPDLDHAWVPDSSKRLFMTELVVPLALRRQRPEATRTSPRADHPESASVATRVCPPGSEWLFAKLYAGRVLEDDLIAGPVRSLAARALAAGMTEGWFFLRYNDPDRHLRLRFRGQPQRLLNDLLPALCAWVNDLMQEGSCRRFVLDTYDREVDRFGGSAGLAAAETLFSADSQAVADLLAMLEAKQTALDRLPLAVLTVDALLDGLGLDAEARYLWCRRHVRARHEASSEYRHHKSTLRAWLGDVDRLRLERGGSAVADIVARLRESAAAFTQSIAALESRGELTRPSTELHEGIVHLHVNRLLGGDRSSEGRVLGLLWRTREGLHRSGARTRRN